MRNFSRRCVFFGSICFTYPILFTKLNNIEKCLILFTKPSNFEKYWCHWNFLYFIFLLINSNTKSQMNIPFLNQSCNMVSSFLLVSFHINDFHQFKKVGQILKYLWLFSSCFKCNIIPTHYRKEALSEMVLAVPFSNI